MKKSKSLLRMLTAAFLLFSACSDENPVGDPNLGSVNPETCVAIGNSLTAGYQSGALFNEAQLYSYPNLLAKQLGSADFEQPLMPYPGTGELRILQQLYPSVVIVSNGIAQNLPTNALLARPYNNLGIPGATIADAIDTSSILQRAQSHSNPFYVYIMRDQNAFGKSLVDQAIALQPTLLTFWLGNNDVLGYAVTGGTQGTNIGLVDPARTMPTERAVFQQVIQAAFAKIKTALPNTKVLVANIPDVTAIPFLTTVPHRVPNKDNPSQPLSIYYRNKEGNVTTAEPASEHRGADYVLLTAQEQLKLGKGFAPGNPLESQFVLDNAEVATVQQAVADYNAILDAECARNGFVLVDIHALFEELNTNGYYVAGEKYTTAFISGGTFSLDGIHPSSRGQAVIANRFIDAMNDAFQANIRYVTLHDIPGIKAPDAVGAGKRGVPWSLEMQFPTDNLLNVFGAR